MIRINKYLSMCGVTSRRGAETLIKEGRVVVNGSTVKELGTVIDEQKDTVKVDGSVVAPVEKDVYIVLNKPRNVMTTMHDPFKRKTVMHFLRDLDERVYPVGRLDYDAEGVLLLTNDGELAYRLTHPKFNVRKTYEVKVEGHFRPENAKQIMDGVKLDDGKIGKAREVRVLGFVKSLTRVRMVLTEGRKREVKQLCQKVGHPVKQLVRVDFGGVGLKNLRSGRWRHLNDHEIQMLKSLVDMR